MKITVKAFTHEGVKKHDATIDGDGTVRVFDSVANHYTTCHILSKRTQARIRKLAKNDTPTP